MRLLVDFTLEELQIAYDEKEKGKEKEEEDENKDARKT